MKHRPAGGTHQADEEQQARDGREQRPGAALLGEARLQPRDSTGAGRADAEDDGPAHGMGIEGGDMVAEEIGPLGQGRGEVKMKLGILRHDGDGAAGRLAGGIQDLDLGESHRLIETQQDRRRRLRQHGAVGRVPIPAASHGRRPASRREVSPRQAEEGRGACSSKMGRRGAQHRRNPRHAIVSRRRPPASDPGSGPAPGASDPRRSVPGRESRSSAIRPWRIPGSRGNRSPRRACRAASR